MTIAQKCAIALVRFEEVIFMESDNSASLKSDDVEKIIANAAEAVVEIFKDVREDAGMAADIGCLACIANDINPKGIYNTLMNPRAWLRARKLRIETFNASEIVSDRAKKASGELRTIVSKLEQTRLHTLDRRTQSGIEKASECVAKLLGTTSQLRFYKLIVHNWQAPDLNAAYQTGLEEYDAWQQVYRES